MLNLIYPEHGGKPRLLELDRYVARHKAGTKLVRIVRPNRTVTSWILQQALINEERGSLSDVDPRFREQQQVADWLKQLMKELENT